MKMGLVSSMLYDAIILGAGPAGLSAALPLCRMKRPAVVFSHSKFRNEKAHHAHTILGHDHTPPADIRAKAREQIEAYGTVHFVEREVISVWKTRDQPTLFEACDSSGATWRGKKVILAMGVEDILPTDIPGYTENWGHNIYQCLFCDGLERSDRPAGLLGFENAMALHNVDMMMQMGCPKVTIFGNGIVEPKDEETAKALKLAVRKGVQIDERKVERLVNLQDEAIEIVFEDGSSTELGFLVHRPQLQIVGKDLVDGLGIEMLPDGSGGQMIKRNEPFGETNVQGVFACGDLGTPIRQVTTAMYQGTFAGAAAHMSIMQDDARELDEV